jgi:hypothetical protein
MLKSGTAILDCQALDCSYNHDGRCHTLGINIGSPDPLCNTFVDAGIMGGSLEPCAKVGACKEINCAHNESLECMYDGIRVMFRDRRPACASYQRRGRIESSVLSLR